ncbi:FIG00996465: hypothetical protein [Rhodococcus aetherivorans]|nr:FIG00996465: hypothetical protein [Rhodococcus aetherivorans]
MTFMPVLPDVPELDRIVAFQHGIVTRAQLEHHGHTWPWIRHRLEYGRWQQVLRGVYSVTTGPLSRPAVLAAAVAFCGDAGILSHRTAAEEWGMLPHDPLEPVHVTVPMGSSTKGQAATFATARPHGIRLPHLGEMLHPGVIVHRSRAHAHIGVPTMPPRTGRADTALDLATAAPTSHDGYIRLIRIVTDSRIPLSEIRRRTQERTPFRYRKALEDAVRLLADGAQSMLELRYAIEVEQRHGLPLAHRQTPVVVDGRTLYEDCTYDGHGAALTVRLDGRRFHSMAEVAFRDRRRDNAAELAGRSRLVYGYDEVSRDPCGVAEEVETVLVRLGWRRSADNRCSCAAGVSFGPP